MENEENGVAKFSAWIRKLPLTSALFASSLGFGVVLVCLLGNALITERFETVNVTKVILRQIELIAIAFLFAYLIRRRQGDKWTNRHWSAVFLLLLAQSWYGVALAAGTYDLLIIIFSGK